MTDYLNIRGNLVGRENTTVGRFYQAQYPSGNVYAVRRTTSRGGSPHFVIEKLLSNNHFDGPPHDVGDTVSCFAAQVYKFTQVPDTVRYRGKQVTAAEQLTMGRWYILIDRDGTEYSGQYATRQDGPCILFTLDTESATRRGRSGRFAVSLDGTSLRKVYKFTQVPKAQPKPVATHAPATEPPAQVAAPVTYPLIAALNASSIGARVGDKFVVIGAEGVPGSKNAKRNHPKLTNGDILVLHRDEGTISPQFLNISRGDSKVFCSWARLVQWTDKTPAPAQEAPNGDVWDDIPIGPKPDPAVFEKAMEAVDLQRAARAIGLLAHEVQKRYDVAQEAVNAHTVAVQALENAQRDLIELAKKATANETI